jgi:hypothetical protein
MVLEDWPLQLGRGLARFGRYDYAGKLGDYGPGGLHGGSARLSGEVSLRPQESTGFSSLRQVYRLDLAIASCWPG